MSVGCSAAAFNHVLLIDLRLAVTSYQGFAKFSAALSPGPNWSLPEANWLDCSDMSKSISQLNGAGRWRAIIAATAAACRLWPCGETELEMSPLNSLLPRNIQVLFLTRYLPMSKRVHVYVCVCMYCRLWHVTYCRRVHDLRQRYTRPKAAQWNEWQLFLAAGDPAANPPQDSSWAAEDGRLHCWICQQIGSQYTALHVSARYGTLP